MVNVDRLVETVPHYLAMLILIFLVLGVVRVTVGELGFWIELVIVLVIAFVYPPLVRRLDVAPSSWERANEQ